MFINDWFKETILLKLEVHTAERRYKIGLDARKPVFGVCEQQIKAQAVQRLCYSLFGMYNI